MNGLVQREHQPYENENMRTINDDEVIIHENFDEKTTTEKWNTQTEEEYYFNANFALQKNATNQENNKIRKLRRLLDEWELIWYH